jgi:glycogen(starch) synthase
MRVLLTTDTIGGGWTFTRELSQELLERGHAVALVSLGREPSVWQREWVNNLETEHGTRFRFEASLAPLEWMENNWLAYEDGASLLSAIAHTFNPDILHFNQYCYGALETELPKLITAHSDVLSWAAACRPHGLEDNAWLRQYCRLVESGLNGASCVAAPTRWMLDALRKGFDFSRGALTIYNGRTVLNVEAHGRRILRAVSVGRLWDEAKGVNTLLETEAPMPVLVAGEGSEAEGLSNGRCGFQALGRLSEAEVLELFRTSSIYIASSVYEPFGLAPLEAAACGCAIVARDLPSLREVWGNAALYFADGAALEQILRRLGDEPEMLHAVQAGCLRRANFLSARRAADSYIATYQRLIDRSKQAAQGSEANAA